MLCVTAAELSVCLLLPRVLVIISRLQSYLLLPSNVPQQNSLQLVLFRPFQREIFPTLSGVFS